MQATSEARAVAALAERKKKIKYAAIAQTHLFYPIAIKTSGVFGPDAYDILCDLACQIKATSNKPNLTAYLFQQISVVVQRGNAIRSRVCWFRFVVIYVMNCVCLIYSVVFFFR